MRRQLRDRIDGDTATSGGSRETAMNDWQVSLAGPVPLQNPSHGV
jgi:hypothetical protein